MCRSIAYAGAPLLLADLLYSPAPDGLCDMHSVAHHEQAAAVIVSVRLVSVLDTVMSVAHNSEEGSTAVKWVEVDNEEDWRWVEDVFESSARILRKAGLKTKVVMRKGNPKQQLLKEAEDWGADTIFVGAKGVRGIDRLLLGSVSAAVAAHAPCSVEVVRLPLAARPD